MGPNLRIQAAAGYRAAVIELKPGLYLVAEIPDQVARPAVGLAPYVGPLITRLASRLRSHQARRQNPRWWRHGAALPGYISLILLARGRR